MVPKARTAEMREAQFLEVLPGSPNIKNGILRAEKGGSITLEREKVDSYQ